jgi:hypothetical protein
VLFNCNTPVVCLTPHPAILPLSHLSHLSFPSILPPIHLHNLLESRGTSDDEPLMLVARAGEGGGGGRADKFGLERKTFGIYLSSTQTPASPVLLSTANVKSQKYLYVLYACALIWEKLNFEVQSSLWSDIQQLLLRVYQKTNPKTIETPTGNTTN